MIHPLITLYTAIKTHIKNNVPEIRYINMDLGQLEFYELRPKLSFPALLIDFGELRFEPLGDGSQMAYGNIIMRLALGSYSDISSLAPQPVLDKGVAFLSLEQKLHQAIQGQELEYFSSLMRIGSSTEKREDEYRVRTMTYDFNFIDISTSKEWSITSPDFIPDINFDFQLNNDLGGGAGPSQDPNA